MKKEKTTKGNETTVNVNVSEVSCEQQTTALVLIRETTEEKAKRLEQENAELKARLRNVPQSLEEKIEFYKLKQEKIKQLNKLEETSNNLFEHMEKLDKLTEENDFVCDKYRLSVGDSSDSYREKPIFQMNNPVIIRDVVKFVLQRIEDKMSVLKMEISE